MRKTNAKLRIVLSLLLTVLSCTPAAAWGIFALPYRPGSTVIDANTSGTYYFSPRSGGHPAKQYAEFRQLLPEELKRKFTTSFWMDDEVTVKFRNGRIIRMTSTRKIPRRHLEDSFYPRREDKNSGVTNYLVRNIYRMDSKRSKVWDLIGFCLIVPGRVLDLEPKATLRTELDFSESQVRCRQSIDGKLYAEGTFVEGKKIPLRSHSHALQDFDARSEWPLHGNFQVYYDDGTLGEVWRFDREKGLLDCRFYRRDGRLSSEHDYRDPEFSSSRRYLYFGDCQRLHEHTVHRKSTGRCVREHKFSFDREGNLLSESLQVEDQPGYCKDYDGKGRLVREKAFLGFELHGIRREYFPNGFTLETPYVHGRAEGVARRFQPDGTLREEIPWRNNRKEGVEKTYWIDEEGYHGRNKGVICTPYEFDRVHGTITDTNFTRGTTRPLANYYFGKRHGLQHENPPRRYYYGVDTGDPSREMPPFAVSSRGRHWMRSWLQTPYQDVCILRNLKVCTAKDPAAMREPDGVLYVVCENPSEADGNKPDKLKLKLAIAPTWKYWEGGFLAGTDTENWRKQTLLKEYPFPSRAHLHSPHEILLRVAERLYRIRLDRQWILSNSLPPDPFELDVGIEIEMIRGPELKK